MHSLARSGCSSICPRQYSSHLVCNHFRVLLIFNEAIAVNAVDNCRFVAVREANEGGRLKIDVFSPDALARLVDRRFSSLQPVAGRFIFDTTSDVDHLCQKGDANSVTW
uniref:Uncharacterized protein n=1 Tax=Romanomermis culicivorax TaxID=13658 RepID=A0A915KQH2_ROMCU